MPNLVHSIYESPQEGVLPHRLSLFFMILTIGAVVDVKADPLSDYRQRADKFHHLARAALCEVSVIDDPSFDCIDSLVRSRNAILKPDLRIPCFAFFFDILVGIVCAGYVELTVFVRSIICCGIGLFILIIRKRWSTPGVLWYVRRSTRSLIPVFPSFWSSGVLTDRLVWDGMDVCLQGLLIRMAHSVSPAIHVCV